VAGILSNSEAIRLIHQGAVKINEKIAGDPKGAVKNGDVFKVGKKKFFKVKI
jgi:ribosomal protein S4